MRKHLTCVLCALVFCSAVHADEGDTLYASASPTLSRWQHTSATMPSSDYQRSVSNNREIVQQELQTYAERLRAKTGAYGQAIGLLGATIAVAATDTRYHLNDSKTVGMVLRDTASNDRTVLVEYRKTW